MQPRALGPERGSDPRAGALLEAILRRGSLGLARAVAESGLPTGTNLLLLVDQFEGKRSEPAFDLPSMATGSRQSLSG